jgi:hypothetical protein
MTKDGQTIDFLISLAEISGVFVGFGVLIGAVQRTNEVPPVRKALAQGISIVGLVAMLTALLPPTHFKRIRACLAMLSGFTRASASS